MKLKRDPTQWDYNIKSEQWLKFLRNDEVLFTDTHAAATLSIISRRLLS